MSVRGYYIYWTDLKGGWHRKFYRELSVVKRAEKYLKQNGATYVEIAVAVVERSE